MIAFKKSEEIGGTISKFRIVGGKDLKGEIEVNGAKNAAMKMIAACCLTPGLFTLENIPEILDVQKEIKILEHIGAKIERTDHRLSVDTTNLQNKPLPRDLIKELRASIVLIGPLLVRFGEVVIPHPGGCMIGARPIDRHIKAFRDLGVEVTESADSYTFKRGSILGTTTAFEKITWTGTENIILFASGLPQVTTIENIALEPEVFNLIELLEKMGAKFEVKGRTAKVTGTANLTAANHTCMSDRLEAATFAIMAAAIGNGIKITNCPCNHLDALLEKFEVMGIQFAKEEKSLYIKKPGKITATDISTAEYPGFVTDTQPPMGLLLTQAEGKSTIRENLFESRLGYLKELKKMGADIEFIDDHEAKISGPTKLHGAHLQSLDLRAGATLLIAGLAAVGETIIEGAENIDRGYEKIEDRLKAIGADIERIA